MNSSAPIALAEVLEQLPEDLQAGMPPEAGIGDVIAASNILPPIGRFSRFWTLGTLQGKIAAAYTFWWFRGMWQGADERQKRLNETHLKAAVQLLGTMSTLRGAVMKLGQIMAHWPGVAPEEFASVLGRLHFQAPPMHFSLLREQIRAELGEDPEELFAEFETEACAAASLGQVHRARLKGSNKLVAVKIQYPGIARTICDDIANIRTMILPMRLGPDGESLMAQLDDIQQMTLAETDYRAELENLKLARQTLAGFPEVVVPEVHEQFSSARVLTMDWLEGVHLDAFLASEPEQALRDQCGERIIRAIMRMGYRANMLHADLHPGNFLFMGDGRVGLLDFGCVRHYSPAELEFMIEGERAGFEDPEAVRQVLIKGADLLPSQQNQAERMRLLTAWYDWVCEPIRTDEKFDFSNPDYINRGMGLWRELMVKRYTRTIPVNTWVSKSFIGMRAMLYRMGARVALGRIMREETVVK